VLVDDGVLTGSIMRFANGRIVETWGIVDVLSQMKQLGVMHA
jgi:predicted ester cyclase